MTYSHGRIVMLDILMRATWGWYSLGEALSRSWSYGEKRSVIMARPVVKQLELF